MTCCSSTEERKLDNDNKVLPETVSTPKAYSYPAINDNRINYIPRTISTTTLN